jgi:hypothetical protein
LAWEICQHTTILVKVRANKYALLEFYREVAEGSRAGKDVTDSTAPDDGGAGSSNDRTLA